MWEKVLVIDDDVDTREKFYEIFSSLCYKPTCVPGGEEGILRLGEERFNLILLDKDMPRMTGIEAVKKIREFDSETKIIILHSDELEEEGKDLIKRLNTYAVTKDFSTHFMMKEILQILKERDFVKEGDKFPERAKGTILVVDDNAEIRDVLGSFLDKKGYKALITASGEEALMKIKIEKPHIVLLDLRMPGMDGIMVLRQIKQFDESISVVMLTSAQEEYLMKQAAENGACDYLVKPCDFNKLDILLTSILLGK